MKFDIVKGDIVDVCADAVVLPANTGLKEGSGTSRAIFKAAGRIELMKACAEYGHCDIGSAVPTEAFNLNAKCIIHAVVPRWKDGNHQEYELLSSAYLSALNMADHLKCQSIVFPLLASGNNGFDKELAFQIAKKSFESFSGEHLKKITLVIYEGSVALLIKSWGYEIDTVSYEAAMNARKAKQKEKQDEWIIKTGDVLVWLIEHREAIMKASAMVYVAATEAINKKQIEDKNKKPSMVVIEQNDI